MAIQITERPILFSTPMVQALLEGRKTQTRRIIDPQPIWAVESDGNLYEGNHKGYVKVDGHPDWQQQFALQFARCSKDDVIWVREEFYQIGHWEVDNTRKRKSGRQAWKFIPDSHEIMFGDNPPKEFRKGRHSKDPGISTWHKRPGRFMPKSIARIWLQVEGVRVERLQDISEQDAIAEGIESYHMIGDLIAYKNYSETARKDFLNKSSYGFDSGKEKHSAPVASFCSLWVDINGRESWISNPWVWVIQFNILSTTGKPDLNNQ